MKIINEEKSVTFLEKNLKGSCDVSAHLELLEKTICEADSRNYELAGVYTKSGRPECIRFSAKRIFLVNGEWIDEETFNNGDYEDCDDYEIEVAF